MTKVLAIGDTDAQYHPLCNIEGLPEILSECETEVTSDRDAFLRLADCDVFVCYIDSFTAPVSDAQAAALGDFFAAGGKMLNIHNGLSLQATPSIEPMLGGRFTHHPEYRTLEIRAAGDHPVTHGAESFSIDDEPYQFEIFGDIKVLATYEHEGRDVPAAWEIDVGAGKMIYLMPGHDAAAFENEGLRTWIRNAVGYLAEK